MNCVKQKSHTDSGVYVCKYIDGLASSEKFQKLKTNLVKKYRQEIFEKLNLPHSESTAPHSASTASHSESTAPHSASTAPPSTKSNFLKSENYYNR